MAVNRARTSVLSPRRVREDLRLSRERMARLMDVSAKTIERWEDRDILPARPLLRERLSKIQEIVQLGLTIYAPEGLTHFLTTRMAEFDGHTPLQLIELGQADRVLAALAADHECLGY